jgi:hypothetical protein
MAVMWLNFHLLKGSTHPYLINIRENWGTISLGLTAVYGSCLAIVLPQTYLLSYLSFGATHILIRWFKHLQRAKVERDRLVKVFKFD